MPTMPQECAFRLRAPLAGAILILAACGGKGAGAGVSPVVAMDGSALVEGQSTEVRSAFARVRAATRRFVSLDSAVAAGYARDVPRCFSDPHHGAMGFHHLNRGYVDTKAEVERPEILLYERRSDGAYALNGVEYIIPYKLWPRDSVPPTVMGETMKQEDNLNLWYLHMWIWRQNPSGLFSDYNPAVHCPEPGL
jgi:hypothetical protein